VVFLIVGEFPLFLLVCAPDLAPGTFPLYPGTPPYAIVFDRMVPSEFLVPLPAALLLLCDAY
jgi:hypothetical protein